jgi:hypothetical protein
MTAKDFILKLRKQAGHVPWEIGVKRLIFNLFILTLAVYAASAVPVSVILSDEFNVRDGNVNRVITAYEAINNVTIIDYFSDVEVQGINAEKDEFLGKKWISVKIPLGDMKKGEIKTVTYNISRSEGDAMPGADVYYIEGERHQLFPKKTIIEVKSAAAHPEISNESINESSVIEPEGGNQNYFSLILFLAAIIIVVIALVIFKTTKKHK